MPPDSILSPHLDRPFSFPPLLPSSARPLAVYLPRESSFARGKIISEGGTLSGTTEKKMDGFWSAVEQSNVFFW